MSRYIKLTIDDAMAWAIADISRRENRSEANTVKTMIKENLAQRRQQSAQHADVSRLARIIAGEIESGADAAAAS